MPEAQLKMGTRVHVEFDGNLADIDHGSSYWRITTADGATHFVQKESTALTVAEPENWPPQAGDVWEADGTVFFLHQELGYPSALFARRADTGKGSPILGFHGLKALNPVLRFRPES